MFDEIPALHVAQAQLATGVRLSYAECGDQEGPTVLLLHGYTDSWFSFSRLLPLLAPKLHLIGPDQRGHGDSERPESGYSIAQYAADALALLDALGQREAFVVGHSMGSFIAQAVALAAPERVRGLVLIGSATTARNPGVLDLRDAVSELSDPVPEPFAREFQASTIHHPVPAPFLDRVVAESLKLPARVWRAALDGLLDADLAGQLGQIAAPALILWGDQDGVFPREEQDLLAAALPSSRLEIYPDTGHALHWERPAQCAKDVLGLVNP
ncbi:MAG TPA: alpha/beta hydrolase [Roseiflexaceae bacterium]|nr:alpha/beta hydrolase [Roseiflexaceae bacterium]